MPTRKIAEAAQTACTHPDHKPASMCVFSPGLYEHTCSACGAVSHFFVPAITARSWPLGSPPPLQQRLEHVPGTMLGPRFGPHGPQRYR